VMKARVIRAAKEQRTGVRTTLRGKARPKGLTQDLKVGLVVDKAQLGERDGEESDGEGEEEGRDEASWERSREGDVVNWCRMEEEGQGLNALCCKRRAAHGSRARRVERWARTRCELGRSSLRPLLSCVP